jgi:hypothetical protein
MFAKLSLTDRNGAVDDNLYVIQERSEKFCYIVCYFILPMHIYFAVFFLHGLVTNLF